MIQTRYSAINSSVKSHINNNNYGLINETSLYNRNKVLKSCYEDVDREMGKFLNSTLFDVFVLCELSKRTEPSDFISALEYRSPVNLIDKVLC